jgi:putative NIF3 family GTP cyclohydrolase 1 type 2
MGHAADSMSIGQLIGTLTSALDIDGCHIVGEASKPAGLVGIACGSGGDLVDEVRGAGCTTMVTGEIRLHAAVEARASGVAVVVVGHHASERFAMETLAKRLAEAVPGLDVFPSGVEADPLAWVAR